MDVFGGDAGGTDGAVGVFGAGLAVSRSHGGGILTVSGRRAGCAGGVGGSTMCGFAVGKLRWSRLTALKTRCSNSLWLRIWISLGGALCA